MATQSMSGISLIGPDGSTVTPESLLGKPLTQFYKTNNDVAHIASWGLQRNPFLDLFKIEQMLLEPGIRLGLRMRKTPLRKATLVIKSKNPAVRAWVATCLQRIWRGGLKKILRGMEYGFSACEVLYKAEDDKAGNRVLFVNGLKEFHPRDVRPLTLRRELCGVRVRSFTTGGSTQVAANSKLIEGTSHEDLFCPKAFWYAHDAHFGNLFGRSILMGAQTPFEETACKGGARDSRAHFYYKHAFRGPVIRYPMTDYMVDTGTGSVRYVNAQDVAAEIAVNAHNGSATLIPNILDPKTGEPVFQVEFPQTSGQSGVDIREYIKDLTKEEWQGLGVPDEVLQGGENGAYSARQIPERAFYTAAEDDLYDLLDQLDTQVLRPVAIMNYGKEVQYEIEVLELTPDDQQQGGENGPTGGRPGGFPGMPPGGGDDDGSGGGLPPELMKAMQDGSTAGSVPGAAMSRQRRRKDHRSAIQRTAAAVRLSLPRNATALIMGEMIVNRKAARKRGVGLSLGHEEKAHGLQMAGHSAADAIADLAITKGLQLSKAVKNRIIRAIVQNPTMSPNRFMVVVERILQVYQPQLAGLLKDSLVATWVKGGSLIARRLPKTEEEEATGTVAAVMLPTDEGATVVGGIPHEATPGAMTAGVVKPMPEGVLAFYGTGEIPTVTFPGADEAWADLQQKIPMTAGEFYKLGDQARTAAFTVSYVTGKDTVEYIRQALLDTLAAGGTLAEFKSRIGDVLDTSPVGPFHIDTVFRTNIQNAYHAGQQRVMADPLVSDAFPYVKYAAISDTRIRENHHAMLFAGIPINGKHSAIYRSDDPIWNIWTPPNGFNCRCGLVFLTLRQAARLGVQEAKDWLASGEPPAVAYRAQPKYQPDPGFASRPSISAGGAVAMSMMAGTATAFAGSVIAPRSWRGVIGGQPIPSARLSRFTRADVVEVFGPVFMAVMHAPKGGISVNGRSYKGGQFIPAGEQSAAKAKATEQVQSAKGLAGHEFIGMKKADGIGYLQTELGYSEEQATALWKDMFINTQGDDLEDAWQDIIAGAPIQDIAAAEVDPIKSGNFETMEKPEASVAMKKMYDDISAGIDSGDVPGIVSDLVSVGYNETQAKYVAAMLCDGTPDRKEQAAGVLALTAPAKKHGITAMDIAKGIADDEVLGQQPADKPAGPQLTESLNAMTSEDLGQWWEKDGDEFYDQLTSRLSEAGLKKLDAAKLAVKVSGDLENGDSEKAFETLQQGLGAHGIVMTPQLKGISPQAMQDWWNRDPDHFLKQLQGTLQEQAGMKKLASAKIAVSISDAMEQGQNVAAYNALADALGPLGFKLPKIAEPTPEPTPEPEQAVEPAAAPGLPPELQAAATADMETDAAVASGEQPPAESGGPQTKPKQKAKDRATLDGQYEMLIDAADAGAKDVIKTWMTDQMNLPASNADWVLSHNDAEGLKIIVKAMMEGSDKAKYVGWNAPKQFNTPEELVASQEAAPAQAEEAVPAIAEDEKFGAGMLHDMTMSMIVNNDVKSQMLKHGADPAVADDLAHLSPGSTAQVQGIKKVLASSPYNTDAITSPTGKKSWGEVASGIAAEHFPAGDDGEKPNPYYVLKKPDGIMADIEEQSGGNQFAAQEMIAHTLKHHVAGLTFAQQNALAESAAGLMFAKNASGQSIGSPAGAGRFLAQFLQMNDLASGSPMASMATLAAMNVGEKNEELGIPTDQYGKQQFRAMAMDPSAIDMTEGAKNAAMKFAADNAEMLLVGGHIQPLMQVLIGTAEDAGVAKQKIFEAMTEVAGAAKEKPALGWIQDRLKMAMTDEAGNEGLTEIEGVANHIAGLNQTDMHAALMKHGADQQTANTVSEMGNDPAYQKELIGHVLKNSPYISEKPPQQSHMTTKDLPAPNDDGVGGTDGFKNGTKQDVAQWYSNVLEKMKEDPDGVGEIAGASFLMNTLGHHSSVAQQWVSMTDEQKLAGLANMLNSSPKAKAVGLTVSVPNAEVESFATKTDADSPPNKEAAKQSLTALQKSFHDVLDDDNTAKIEEWLTSYGGLTPAQAKAMNDTQPGAFIKGFADQVLENTAEAKAAGWKPDTSGFGDSLAYDDGKNEADKHVAAMQESAAAQKLAEKPKPVVTKVAKKQILAAKNEAVKEHIAGIHAKWSEAAGKPFDPHAAVKMALSTMTPENVAATLTGTKADKKAGMAATSSGLAALGYSGPAAAKTAKALQHAVDSATSGEESLDAIHRAIAEAIQASPAHKAMVAANLNPDGTAKPIADVTNDVKVISSSIGGSTGAKKVEIGGREYVLKSGGTDGGGGHQELHATNEVVTNNVLQAMGVNVPQSKTVQVGGTKYAANKWLNISPVSTDDLRTDAAVQDSFAAQALMGNWDAIGASVDNVGKDEHGNIVFIDNGGAGGFRAMGKKKKPEDWGAGEGSIVKELDTMRKMGNSGQAWGQLSDAQVSHQINKLANKIPPKETLANMAKASGLAHSDEEASAYADTVHARMDYMKHWAQAVQAGVSKPPNNHAGYESWKAQYGNAIHTNHAEKAKFKVQKTGAAYVVQQNIGGEWKSISEPIPSPYHAIAAAQQAKAAAIGGSWKPVSSPSGVVVHSAKPGSVDMANLTYQVKEHQVGNDTHWTVEKQTKAGEWLPLKSYSGKSGLATAKKFIKNAVEKAGYLSGSHGEKYYDATGSVTHTDPELPALYSEHKWHEPITAAEKSAASKYLNLTSGKPATNHGKVKNPDGTPALSMQEWSALYHYFNSSYSQLNEYLRKNAAGLEPKNTAYDGYAKMISTGLAKLLKVKGGYVGTLYRKATLTASEIARYEKLAGSDQVLTEPHFASTSTSPYVWSGSTHFHIKATGLWAPDCHNYSQHSSEQECLAISGARYKVLKVEKQPGGQTIIHMEETA